MTLSLALYAHLTTPFSKTALTLIFTIRNDKRWGWLAWNRMRSVSCQTWSKKKPNSWCWTALCSVSFSFFFFFLAFPARFRLGSGEKERLIIETHPSQWFPVSFITQYWRNPSFAPFLITLGMVEKSSLNLWFWSLLMGWWKDIITGLNNKAGPRLTVCMYRHVQCCLWTGIPLDDPLQCEVAEAVCKAFLSQLHVLLTGRTWEQHGGMGGILPPPPWVCPTHWEKDAGVERMRKRHGERYGMELLGFMETIGKVTSRTHPCRVSVGALWGYNTM